MTQEALELALEALQFALHIGFPESSESQIKKGEKAYQQHRAAITAIKEALAQPEQEPVAYLCENAVGHKYFRWKKPSSAYKPVALYTIPPPCPTCEALARTVMMDQTGRDA